MILATGYADMEAVGTVVPVERVLRKPFRSEELVNAVHDVLSEVAVAG